MYFFDLPPPCAAVKVKWPFCFFSALSRASFSCCHHGGSGGGNGGSAVGRTEGAHTGHTEYWEILNGEYFMYDMFIAVLSYITWEDRLIRRRKDWGCEMLSEAEGGWGRRYRGPHGNTSSSSGCRGRSHSNCQEPPQENILDNVI